MSKQAILADLKKSGKGFIGSFVIGGGGQLAASDMPELFQTVLDKASLSIHFLVGEVQKEWGVEKIQVDTESGSVFITVENNIKLVSLVSEDINLGFFYILAKRAATLLNGELDEKRAEAAPTAQIPQGSLPSKMQAPEMDISMLIKADLEPVLGPLITEKLWQNQIVKLRGEGGKINIAELEKVLKDLQEILTIQLGRERANAMMGKIKSHFTISVG